MLVSQRNLSTTCSNGYECQSNLCSNGKCASPQNTSVSNSSNTNTNTNNVVKCTTSLGDFDVGEISGDKYCNSQGQLTLRKSSGTVCSNDYECQSDDCSVTCQDVTSDFQPVGSDNSSEEGNGSSIFWILISVLIIAILIVGFFAWRIYKKKHSPENKFGNSGMNSTGKPPTLPPGYPGKPLIGMNTPIRNPIQNNIIQRRV